MPNYGRRSKSMLITAHEDLQRLFNEVIKHIDCAIISGHRDEQEQNELYRQHKSKVMFPNSDHNASPSNALDVVPWPIDWHNTKRFYYFAGIVMGIATQMGINIYWGGDWDSDHDLNDQTFFDLPHFGLRRQ